MNFNEREIHIQKLLNKIKKQRFDLKSAYIKLLNNSEYYDNSYLTFLKIKNYITLSFSIISIYYVRGTNKFFLWIKRGFYLWNTWRSFKKTIS